MSFDEFYFHRRRTLKRWERWGHPVDTFFFLICLGFLLVCEPSVIHVWVFAGLAAVNCLVITKDEWQHRELCLAAENWLHALLFILHPLILAWAAWLWWSGAADFRMTVGVTALLAFGFFLYQIFFWNVWRRD